MNRSVQIKSITPNDKYHVVGRTGTLINDSLEIGSRLVVSFGDGYLSTSPMQEIKQTSTGITAKTKNSVYELVYLEKEEK